MTSADADIIRNDIKKGVFDKKSFVNTMVKKCYEKSFVSEITKLLSKDGEFVYSKSHAIGYTMQIYYMAYLKAHYPNLNYEEMQGYLDMKLNEYSKECHKSVNEKIKHSIEEKFGRYKTILPRYTESRKFNIPIAEVLSRVYKFVTNKTHKIV